MRKGYISRGGFALPTVLIASVVMLTIMTVSVSSVATIRNSLKVQYYEQIAKIAGEAGVAYAKACLAKNGNVPLWTDEKPLTPATDCAGNSMLTPAVQALVVAGGGGGGAGHGGGGGGGGVIQDSAIAVSAGTYPVTVGSGGTGGTNMSAGSNGGSSTFASVTATGGGGGGARINASSFDAARDGGSGGGGTGTYSSSTGSGSPGGTGVPGEGNDGGNGSAGSSGSFAGNGGGGGGAGGPGETATGIEVDAGSSGAGGPGLLSDLSGQQIYYGAGGSGGRWGTGLIGAAGLTGGGTGAGGSAVAGTAGQANTGAGGGGGSGGDGSGGAGGSGVVIIRYGYSPTNQPITATGGTVYQSGPYRVHRFTSNANFTVTGTGTASCPTDPRCSVTVNENLRSSFSVTRPSVDEAGRAVSIPNSGYVELLRDSTGEVWRTYRQPATQVAVAPDLCSGAATSSLGWSSAVRASTQATLPGITTAQTITLANEPLNAGHMYYRKDFTVNQSDTYTVVAQTSSSSDIVEIYVDGVLRTTAQNGAASAPVSLGAGCHTVTAKLTNKTLLPRESHFTAAIQRQGSEPIVATDTTWRASAGSSVPFSHSDFYADPAVWTDAIDFEMANSIIPSWGSLSNDPFARLIASQCTNTCPPSSSTYFRDDRSFILDSNSEILVSAMCDDDCAVYIDGVLTIQSSPWSNINQQTVVLTAGEHRVGVRLYNGGAVTNPSKFAVSLFNRDTNQVVARSNIHWQTANDVWVPGTAVNTIPLSYEDSFRPSPAEIPEPPLVDVLVVGGGGGGGSNSAGGGGGGGVVYRENVEMTLGSKTVTVGSGGANGTSAVAGLRGGNSTFWTITAAGGGGGASRDGGAAATSGGSGGGGAGPTAGGVVRHGGAPGTFGQGGNGNNGIPADAGVQAKGGGGGGAGGAGVAATTAVAGNGGPGYISYITGTRLAVAGGGGGSNTAGNGTPGIATDGGSVQGAPGPAANTGGGGGGSSGPGGSGVVIIRFKTGTMTVSVTGNPQVSYITVKGVPYTVYRFTTSGTFNPTAFTP